MLTLTTMMRLRLFRSVVEAAAAVAMADTVSMAGEEDTGLVGIAHRLVDMHHTASGPEEAVEVAAVVVAGAAASVTAEAA